MHAVAVLLPANAAVVVAVHPLENAAQSASEPVPADALPPAGVLETFAAGQFGA